MSEAPGLDWRTARVVAIAFLIIKLALMAISRPFMDETYYFLWGQHLSLSYFDHPPMIGWTEGLAGALFGWSILGLRFFVLVTLFGDLLLLWLLARHLKGTDDWPQAFWPSAAILLATPIFLALTNVALPDHLLLFFSLVTVYSFERLRTSGAPRWLYCTGLAIGLATLSKYTGALLGIGLVPAILFSSRLRPLLRSPHLYLAGLLAIALQAPVLIWNLQHNFASFGFIVGGRGALGHGDLSGLTGFALGALAVLSPFLIWPIARFLFTRRDGHELSRWVFWVSTLGFLAASLFTNILIHWNVVAYVAVLPFLFVSFRSRVLFWLHAAYGLIVAGAIGLNYAVLPVMSLISFADQTSAWSYGWDEVAARIADIRKTEQIGFVAATDYSLASPLAFALADRDVTSLSPGRDAFDDWFDARAHTGQTALIVADKWRSLPDVVRAQFADVAEAGSVDVEQYGRTIDHYTIYIARGFTARQ